MPNFHKTNKVQLPFLLTLLVLSFLFSSTLIAGESVAGTSDLNVKPALRLSGSESEINLIPHMTFWRNPDKAMPVRTILNSKLDHFGPLPHPNSAINFGNDRSEFWHQVKMVNTSDKMIKVLLEIRNPKVDTIRLYQVNSGSVWRYDGGNLQSFTERKIKSNIFLFSLKLPPGEEQTFLISTKSSLSAHYPFRLFLGDSYEVVSLTAELNFGLFFGIIIGLIGYNTFLFAKTRLPLFFFFIVHSIFTGVATLSRENYLAVLLPDMPLLNNHLFSVMPMLAVISLTQLSRHYLETFRYSTVVDRILLFFIAYTILITIGMIAGLTSEVVMMIYGYPAFVLAISYFYAGVSRYRMGHHPAIFFLIGVSLPILSGLLKVLLLEGVIVRTVLIEALITNSETFQLLIFSLGLAEVINKMTVEANEIEQEATVAKTLLKAKNEFLNNMSYRIRTPMNAVVGNTELLLTSAVSDEQSRYLKIISNSAKSLLIIMDDILDIHRVQVGDIVIHESDFCLSEVVEDCMSVFTVIAMQKKIDFYCHIEEDVPLQLIGDVNRLRQILINLISNSIKFTNEGSVTIQISVKAELSSSGQDGEQIGHGVDQEKQTIVLKIIDTGIGIPPEKINQLFQAYSQAEESTTREFGGTGLGLTICKHISDAMGGSISVESQPGRGSTFIAELPFGMQSESQKVADTFRQLTNKSILMVAPSSPFSTKLEAELRRLTSKLDCFLSTKESGYVEKVEQTEYDYAIFFDEVGPLAIIEELGRVTLTSTSSPLVVKLHDEEVQAEAYIKLKQLGVVVSLQPWSIQQVMNDMIDLHDRTDENTNLKYSLVQNYKRQYPEPLTIVFGEANDLCRRVTKAMLLELGHQVIMLGNGREVADLYKESHEVIDLILLSLDLPELDGFKVTRAIRSFEGLSEIKQVPIAAISAHAMYEDKKACIEVGMQAHLGKPISLDGLIKLICQLVHENTTGRNGFSDSPGSFSADDRQSNNVTQRLGFDDGGEGTDIEGGNR